MGRWSVPNPAGQVYVFGPDTKSIERDTLRCCHCGGHWVVEPGSGRDRGFCLKCMGPLCGKEKCMKDCYPIEKRYDDSERGIIIP